MGETLTANAGEEILGRHCGHPVPRGNGGAGNMGDDYTIP
jgi:hypothetical protein